MRSACLVRTRFIFNNFLWDCMGGGVPGPPPLWLRPCCGVAMSAATECDYESLPHPPYLLDLVPCEAVTSFVPIAERTLAWHIVFKLAYSDVIA